MLFHSFPLRRTAYIARALQGLELASQHRSCPWSTHHSLHIHYPLPDGNTPSLTAHNCCLASGPKHHTFEVFSLHSTRVVHWIWDATHCRFCRPIRAYLVWKLFGLHYSAIVMVPHEVKTLAAALGALDDVCNTRSFV
jgi:hypothetical protein